jgi:hypothetical protein
VEAHGIGNKGLKRVRLVKAIVAVKYYKTGGNAGVEDDDVNDDPNDINRQRERKKEKAREKPGYWNFGVKSDRRSREYESKICCNSAGLSPRTDVETRWIKI